MAIRFPIVDHRKPAVAWAIVVTACVANFIDLFQSSMVLFALNDIRPDMGFSAVNLNWVVLSYTLTFATFLLPADQMADRLGLRITFIAGTLTLAWTNVLSAWAPNQKGLLAGRALADVGAAGASATGIAIISHLFPPGKAQNAGLAAYVSCAPLGTILGVIIGALLTAFSVGWRANFWLTFILAILVSVIGLLLLPAYEVDAERKARKIDYIGLFAFITGTALFIYGLNDAERLGLKDPAILVNMILGALMLISFPYIERKISDPVLPPAILLNRQVIVPLSTFAITGGCWVTWFFVATQASLNLLHYKVVLAACYFLPATGAAVIGGVVGNALVDRGYPKIPIVGGYTISVGALVPWGFVAPKYGIWFVIVFSMLYLFASPPITVGAQSIILHNIPVGDHGTASALMYVAYQFGSSLFDMNTESGMKDAYHNAMWTLLALTAAGYVTFVVFYLGNRAVSGSPSAPVERLEKEHKSPDGGSNGSNV
ncbi:uncharacterized protein K452DRAFT_350308 [Aplosporella prunicola CBS 121167]|uniref:Major facilitator superfamily (MFS) profile domain-containing protein n=1 Tax=Aplosporella prunicola CBS 121167 TaxID=1176127 RepID=A0A6A6BGB2_9PEZI|nr:uncharacterized protein K452DRAFT_350308 [Aplosporella prunicola CBS 121167]KAF2143179.1 hypothetical protein K452DRAFT_350308 [Aplosporella prunicola CBS 121167]